jgi:CheY-like chemotaxis protein
MAKILIVDDKPLITAMLEDWLSELGHDVVGLAYNLAKALELAKSEIDAAIVDVSLGKDNACISTRRGLDGPRPGAGDGPWARRHRSEIPHTVDAEETIRFCRVPAHHQ